MYATFMLYISALRSRSWNAYWFERYFSGLFCFASPYGRLVCQISIILKDLFPSDIGGRIGVRRLREACFGLPSKVERHLEEAVDACHPSDPDLLVAKHRSWSILCSNVQSAEPRLTFHHMQHVIETTHRPVHVHHIPWHTGANPPFLLGRRNISL